MFHLTHYRSFQR